MLQSNADFMVLAVVPDGYIIAFRRDISTIHDGNDGGRRHNLGDGKGNTVGTVGELLIADFTGSSQNAVVENPAAQIAVVPAFGRGHHFGKRIGCIDRHLQRVGVESPLQRLAIGVC